MVTIIYVNYLYIIWTLPVIILSYLLNISYNNNIVINYCKLTHPNKKFKYNYNDKIHYLAHKIWYHIVFIVFIIQSTIISYIPYIGLFLDCYLTSLIYSFYCWEYLWGLKIEHKIRFKVFSKLFYFLGFGTIFGVIKSYFHI